jgi:hypothetical protein
MAILAIGRYFVGDPNIVGIVTTDDLATIIADGYLTAQQPIINSLINGDFEWLTTDLILIYYSPTSIGFFTRDAINNTFVEFNQAGQVQAITGTSRQILSNNTSGTPETGNITLTIANNPILPGTGGVTLPTGTTIQRAGSAGTIRFNSQTSVFEGTVNGSAWSSLGSSSIQGTANQVLANGTSGSPVTGAVILTLPQDINTISSPSFTALTAGNLNLINSTLSSISTNSNLALVPNGTAAVLIGQNTAFAPIAGFPNNLQIISKSGSQAGLTIGTFLANGQGSVSYLYKSRSTSPGSFTTVQVGDSLGLYGWSADDGTSFVNAANIGVFVTAISPGSLSTRMAFLLRNGVSAPTGALQLNSDQTAQFFGNVTNASGHSFISNSPTINLGSLALTGANNAGNFANILTNASTAAARTWTLPDATGTIALTSQLATPAALTKTDDTNVTLTLGGTPSTALLQATSLTLGWTGLLSPTRGGTGVNNSTNTLTINANSTINQNVSTTAIPTFGSLITTPANSDDSSLSLGTAYQNTLGYDIVLTVYLAITAATAGSVAVGVGATNTPTQQNVISGFTIAALSIIPITIYLPTSYYALVSLTSVTGSISGQQIMPV